MVAIKALVVGALGYAGAIRKVGHVVRTEAHHAEPQPAAQSLVHFLAGEQSAPEDFEDFLPKCVDHVKALVADMDQAYTDTQLGPILEGECIRVQSFPKSQDAGFTHEDACSQLSKKLVAAREEELKTGSVVGYETWCEFYYTHKVPGASTTISAAPPAEEAPAEEKPAKASEDAAAAKPAAKTESWKVVVASVVIAAIALGTVYLGMTRC